LIRPTDATGGDASRVDDDQASLVPHGQVE